MRKEIKLLKKVYLFIELTEIWENPTSQKAFKIEIKKILTSIFEDISKLTLENKNDKLIDLLKGLNLVKEKK